MSSNLNYDDLDGYPVKDLKNEAARLNINTPPRINKRDLIQLLQDHQRDSQTFISKKLIASSSSNNSTRASQNNSQRASQNNSSRQSPIPKNSPQFQTHKNISPQPINNENNVRNTFSSENTFQRGQVQEENEKSPLLPSSSSKRKPHSSHKKTPHADDERKVHYTNTDRHDHTHSLVSQTENYTIPKKLVVMNYLFGGLAILFAIFAISSTPLFIVAIFHLILFLILQHKLNSLLEKKSHSLAPKIITQLKKVGGRALRSDLKSQFNVDTTVMRRLSSYLVEKKRIRIKEKKDKDQEWVLIE